MFLWGLGLLELEEIEIEYTDVLAEYIADFINTNIESYTEQDYGFNKEVITRYLKTAEFFSSTYQIDTTIYIAPKRT
ncbi:MAG: hypothetical protein IPJ43_09295 [Saprospiraceae bacterium]|nr:hypothetical protein [Saprospiraceae bacterium]